jgi:hypothetical protein
MVEDKAWPMDCTDEYMNWIFKYLFIPAYDIVYIWHMCLDERHESISAEYLSRSIRQRNY